MLVRLPWNTEPWKLSFTSVGTLSSCTPTSLPINWLSLNMEWLAYSPLLSKRKPVRLYWKEQPMTLAQLVP